jgi:serine/threonine-protein kinase
MIMDASQEDRIEVHYSMTTIILNRSWRLGNQLASGGFGRVHEAEADDGSAAVVKLVPKAPGASRELLFEELSGSPNIIPILDSGEWQDYYVIVMPRAEKSLRKHLEETGGRLDVNEAVAVLIDVAEALASLEAEVVHRDLKPENVLMYERHWCLADFGIARYAEATTAPDTRKFAMTPPYAAPEQWRGERATHATDVYAFGVMAFELLEGRLPFPGPDFRQQHLNEPAPALSGCPSWLASLVNECLFKASAARPTAANILARLRGSGKPASPAAERLQQVQKAVVERQGEEAARMSAQRSREELRRDLFHAAKQSFDNITEALRQRILEAAPATNVSMSGGRLVLQLGEGALVIDLVQAAPAECLAAFDYEPPFDVVGYSAIAARKPRDRYGYEGRAHSLWFCDAHDEGIYRWYELAFMVRPSIPQRYTLDPFALPPTDKQAAAAFTPVMDVRQVAWQPIPFDQGEEDQFIERWLEWFAAAADGSLSHPSTMPENSGGRYRSPRPRRR